MKKMPEEWKAKQRKVNQNTREILCRENERTNEHWTLNNEWMKNGKEKRMKIEVNNQLDENNGRSAN